MNQEPTLTPKVVFTDLVVNPPAAVYVLPFDDKEFIILRVDHPTHGPLNFWFPFGKANAISLALSQACLQVLPAASPAAN